MPRIAPYTPEELTAFALQEASARERRELQDALDAEERELNRAAMREEWSDA